MHVSDLSPYAYVSDIDFGFSEFEALRETTASWYSLMKTLAAGGFVITFTLSWAKVAVLGEKEKYNMFCGISAKGLVIIFLFGFAALFAVFGEMANSIIASMF